jgi:NTP pyrophosphatase (non-canonical NTP hydrolase)
MLDLTKKYTTSRGGDIVISIDPIYRWDNVIDGYTVLIESGTSQARYKIFCDVDGKSQKVMSDDKIILDKHFVQTNFDLVEITGYHDGKVTDDIQSVARQHYPDIDTYVDQKVNWFALYMKNKLTLNLYKGKWDNYTVQWLFEKLLVEISELYNATVKYDNEEYYEKIINESADIANYALMIADIINKKYEKRG